MVPVDKFHYHEVIDRLVLIQKHFYEDIIEHPVVYNTESLTKQAEKVLKDMGILVMKLSLDEVKTFKD
jgi:hypothetical protein